MNHDGGTSMPVSTASSSNITNVISLESLCAMVRVLLHFVSHPSWIRTAPVPTDRLKDSEPSPDPALFLGAHPNGIEKSPHGRSGSPATSVIPMRSNQRSGGVHEALLILGEPGIDLPQVTKVTVGRRPEGARPQDHRRARRPPVDLDRRGRPGDRASQATCPEEGSATAVTASASEIVHDRPHPGPSGKTASTRAENLQRASVSIRVHPARRGLSVSKDG
jgi:hypothetical protein